MKERKKGAKMYADEQLICEIDMERKCVEVPCPTWHGKIVLHTIAFRIGGQIVSAMGFNFEREGSIGIETLKKYLCEHITKLYDVRGRQIPNIDLTDYEWNVQPMPMGRGDESAEMVLREMMES